MSEHYSLFKLYWYIELSIVPYKDKLKMYLKLIHKKENFRSL